MIVLFYVLVFIVGAVIGSFLNVVIDRVPRGETIFVDRSKCDHCKKTLRWFELIPLGSFAIQKGKCRRCGRALSFQYPIVELLTAVLVVTFVYVSFSVVTFESIGAVILILALIPVAVIDIKLLIIPDQLMYFLLFVFVFMSLSSVGLQVVTVGVSSGGIISLLKPVLDHLVVALLSGGFFYALLVITKGKGMGGGDVKLAYVMGLFLTGMQTLVAIYTAFILGAVVGVFLLILGRKKFGQVVPFGPFLSLGVYVSLLWSQQLIDLYLTVFTIG